MTRLASPFSTICARSSLSPLSSPPAVKLPLPIPNPLPPSPSPLHLLLLLLRHRLRLRLRLRIHILLPPRSPSLPIAAHRRPLDDTPQLQTPPRRFTPVPADAFFIPAWLFTGKANGLHSVGGTRPSRFRRFPRVIIINCRAAPLLYPLPTLHYFTYFSFSMLNFRSL
jgi:hypothetical protein